MHGYMIRTVLWSKNIYFILSLGALSSSSGPAGYRWRNYGSLAIIMVGIAFGFHQLYKVSQTELLLLFALCFPNDFVFTVNLS